MKRLDSEGFRRNGMVDFFEAGPIREANRTAYGLSAGLLSNDRGLFESFRRRARADIINWNRGHDRRERELALRGRGPQRKPPSEGLLRR